MAERGRDDLENIYSPVVTAVINLDEHISVHVAVLISQCEKRAFHVFLKRAIGIEW